MSAIDRETYDELYRSAPAVWSGRPNRQLVVEAADLRPGTALDAGSGEGGDALWLAERGWRVTAVDFSPVALERGAARAAERGLADRIEWRHEDLDAHEPGAIYTAEDVAAVLDPEEWSDVIPETRDRDPGAAERTGNAVPDTVLVARRRSGAR